LIGGAPLLLASDIAIFFGAYDRMAPVAKPEAVAALTTTHRDSALSPA
jgi:hypothetical protein